MDQGQPSVLKGCLGKDVAGERDAGLGLTATGGPEASPSRWGPGLRLETGLSHQAFLRGPFPQSE